MEGEEAAALAAYRAARSQHPGLRLVLVPRHAERFDAVAAWLEQQGETVVRRSQLGDPRGRRGPAGRPPVILVDTIGELAAVWGLADVAFVGGSLLPGRGGQNMMEPAAFGAAVLFGPHTANFRETVEQLLAATRPAGSPTPTDWPAACWTTSTTPRPPPPAARPAAHFVLAQHGAAGRTLAELDRLVESVDHRHKAGLIAALAGSSHALGESLK